MSLTLTLVCSVSGLDGLSGWPAGGQVSQSVSQSHYLTATVTVTVTVYITHRMASRATGAVSRIWE